MEGHLDVVSALLRTGVDIDAENKDGCTALMRASQNGHLDVVSKLVGAGANKEAQNKDGWTALMFASQSGHLDVVSKLVEAGANIEAQNKDGWAALMRAFQNGLNDMVPMLVEAVANIEAQNKDGWVALMRAFQNGLNDMVPMLVEAVASIEAQNKNGLIDLMFANFNGHQGVVFFLLFMGAQIGTRNKEGESTLDYFIRGVIQNYAPFKIVIKDLRNQDNPTNQFESNFLNRLENDPDDLELSENISRSRFSEVCKGRYKGDTVAVKTLLSFCSAFYLLVKCSKLPRFPNVVKPQKIRYIYSYSHQRILSVLVMEYVSGGTLSDLLHSDRDISWEQRIQIACEIVSALTYLHSAGFVYGDLKSSKILMGEDLQPKLCLSTGLLLGLPPCLHTDRIPWMAPELFQKNAVCTKQSDVYSLGVVLLVIVIRDKFSREKSVDSLIRDIPEDCPAALSSLIASCCQSEPSNRPDTWAIYHLWLEAVLMGQHTDSASLQEVNCGKIEGANSVSDLLGNTSIYIAHGTYGKVYRGRWKDKNVAVKVLYNVPTSKAQDEFLGEVRIMQTWKHLNIVPIFGYCLELSRKDPFCCIVMKYMSKGSLYDVLHSNADLPWDTRIRIADHISRGLEFLHQNNIVHRDLKSANVILNGDYVACLCDFGLAIVKHETRSISTDSNQAVGTLAWMAPELQNPVAIYKKESDIYSLGITFWEIAARKAPFKDITTIGWAIPNLVLKGVRDEIPKDCPQFFENIIRACWEGAMYDRPDIEEVVELLVRFFSML